MRLCDIYINNFRGVSEFCAKITNGMLVIVGQNDVGKSSILRAIQVFLETEKISENDFPNMDKELEIIIQISFEVNGYDYLKHDGLLKLKKIFKLNQNKIYQTIQYYGQPLFPSDEELTSYKILKETGIKLGIEFPDKKPGSETIESLRQQVMSKINEYKNTYTWIDVKEYWQEIKALFPEVIFIPAAQDYINEQKMTNDTSLFGKLFRVGIRKWLQVDEKSKEALDVIQNKVEELNEQILQMVEKRLKEHIPLAQKLSQKLDPLDVSKGFSFTMYVKDEHGAETLLSQRGSGLQRAVLIAAIRAQNDINKYISSMSNDQHESNNKPNYLYLFEEPEAFLHLVAQKDLYYSLKDMTNNSSQVIITTHSTFFIDESDMENVVLLKRFNNQTFSLQHIPSIDIKDELGEMIRISQLITGKVCCIVEGKSDKIIFENWLKTLGYDHRKLGIHFISMDGCTNADYYANASILDDFRVDYLIVMDNVPHEHRDSQQIKKYLEDKNKKLVGRIILLNGEIENYFDLNIVSSVLNIPIKYIDYNKYHTDPKLELKNAKDKAIRDGLKNVKAYNEVRDGNRISKQMSKDNILKSNEITNILKSLIEIAGEQFIV